MDNTNNGEGLIGNYMTPVAVIVGAVIIAFALAYGQGGVTQPTTSQGTQGAAVDIKDVKTDNSPVIGNPNAPITMAYWFDYQCPFCKQFEQTAMPQLYENYIKTGKVKIVLKDFQFLGPDSDTAAEFARAVWEMYPDRFYDWYKAIFEKQDAENGGFGNPASVLALTKTVAGIDGDAVAATVSEKKAAYDQAIAADRAEGSTFGVNGTPSMIIGTTLLAGAQPYAAVSALIDAQLAK